MSKSSKRNKKRMQGGMLWQTAAYNSALYESFRSQIINLALSRFRWINIPSTCDARFLEWTLLVNGIATIAHPKNDANNFYSTQAAALAPWNVYDNPTAWDSFGNGGWNFHVTPENGVLIYDNLARQPLLPVLELYARELVDIMVTKRLNRQHQKVPFVLTGSQDQRLDMLNIYKQVDGGEPAVIATNGFSDIKFDALKTDVPYIGAELQAEFQNVWNMVYTALGIENQTFKKERQIEDEVISATRPSEMMALSPLDARREACEKLNARFPQFAEKPINVVWNQDIASDNYNYNHDVAEQAEEG